ncbi:MAG TPA: dihydrofolate reductase family protein [Solirubrobacterales bacterium]|jgi:dihydrofolate reductase|nr:dihydrofolate reductase family protein [Solirubrobacterales bacterium]
MPKVKAQISVSLDGYMAGPNQSEANPLGEGAEALHEWALKLATWREGHGREGGDGEENPSSAVLAAAQQNIGAVVMGRNMFGPIRGDWPDEDWKGWWGDDPPFHCPVYVLTHHARDPFELEGGTSFHFVTGGIERAVAEAKEAADDQDVSVGGGAHTLRQSIIAGLLDEILVSQVPVVLGGGERPLDHLPTGAKVELAAVVEGPEALHLTYRLG